jgi:hypothetical protein
VEACSPYLKDDAKAQKETGFNFSRAFREKLNPVSFDSGTACSEARIVAGG